MDPRLEAVTGPLKGVVFPITAERVSIGSDPSNELSIYDVSIASTHCLITRHGDSVAVTDLESGQGTFVNGVPVRERILQDSDTLTIGECELVFRNGSEMCTAIRTRNPGGTKCLTTFLLLSSASRRHFCRRW